MIQCQRCQRTLIRQADRCPSCQEARRLRVLHTKRTPSYTRRQIRCETCGTCFALLVFDGDSSTTTQKEAKKNDTSSKQDEAG